MEIKSNKVLSGSVCTRMGHEANHDEMCVPKSVDNVFVC